jgi:hypothetical protein
MPYEAKLPDGVSLPPGFNINTNDPRYKALEALATRENLSQSAFGQILAVEASRVSAEYERARAAPAPTPAPAPAKVDMSTMTTAQQFHHALQKSAAARRGG